VSQITRRRTPGGTRRETLDKIQVKTSQETLSARTRKDARDTLRAPLTCAVQDETIDRNPVSNVKMTTRRAPKARRKSQAWSVDDARWFLVESSWHAG
jgi:hypothetical protein